MSETPESKTRGGTVWDWPNQQVVRHGDGPGVDTPPNAPSPTESDTESTGYRSKAELVADAEALGINTEGKTRDELMAEIDAAGG